MKKLTPEKTEKKVLKILDRAADIVAYNPEGYYLYEMFKKDLVAKFRKGSIEHGNSWQSLDCLMEVEEESMDKCVYIPMAILQELEVNDPLSEYIVRDLTELLEDELILAMRLKKVQALRDLIVR